MEVLVAQVRHPRLELRRSRAPWRPAVEPASASCAARWRPPRTHFSATFWSSTSRVVVTRRPPRFSASQPASSPHSALGELVADGPHEMGGDPARRGLAGEHDLRRLRGREVLRACTPSPDIGVRPAASRSRIWLRRSTIVGVLADDERRVRTLRVLLDDRRAALLGVAHEVVVRGRLGERGDDRGLGRGDAPRARCRSSDADRGLHAVALVAVVVLVEVGGDDLLLALRHR